MPNGEGLLDTSRLHPEAQRLRDFLATKLIGQSRAVETVVEAYDSFLSPLRKPEGPILSLLALGPSGTGKTYLLELLALLNLGDKRAITKVACANFQDRYELAKLLGSAPGLIGYDEEPRLSQWNIDKYAFRLAVKKLKESGDERITALEAELKSIDEQMEKARAKGGVAMATLRSQYRQKENELSSYIYHTVHQEPLLSFLLFDELEKGHEAIHDFLLDVTDKGIGQLSNGEETDFTNSFIAMTSNLGSRLITDLASGKHRPGFIGETAKAAEKTEQEVYKLADGEAKKFFKPEFLNRVTVVVFRPLTLEALLDIFDNLVAEKLEQVRVKGFCFEPKIRPAVKEFIVKEATDHPEEGARLLRKKIDKYLFKPLGRLINSGQITKTTPEIYVELDKTGDKPTTTFSTEERKPNGKKNGNGKRSGGGKGK